MDYGWFESRNWKWPPVHKWTMADSNACSVNNSLYQISLWQNWFRIQENVIIVWKLMFVDRCWKIEFIPRLYHLSDLDFSFYSFVHTTCFGAQMSETNCSYVLSAKWLTSYLQVIWRYFRDLYSCQSITYSLIDKKIVLKKVSKNKTVIKCTQGFATWSTHSGQI